MNEIMPIPPPPKSEFADMTQGQLLVGVQEALTLIGELRRELMKRGVSLTLTFENGTNALMVQLYVLPKRNGG